MQLKNRFLARLFADYEALFLIGLAMFYVGASAFYPYFNHPRPWTFSFVIFIDRLIKFSPAWIVFYVIWYAYLPLLGIFLFRKNRQLYLRWIIAMILGIGSSFFIYSVFQTTVPRPLVGGKDVFSAMVRIIYSNDQPYNCFPSIHVLTTFITMLAIGKLQDIRKIIAGGAFIVGWLINFSTLFTKQHVFADMLAGIALATLTFYIADAIADLISRRWFTKTAV